MELWKLFFTTCLNEQILIKNYSFVTTVTNTTLVVLARSKKTKLFHSTFQNLILVQWPIAEFRLGWPHQWQSESSREDRL